MTSPVTRMTSRKMSMIGSQSSAYQCQSNGLSRRVPYDVGRSIRTCSSTAIVDTDASIANDAFSAPGGGGRRSVDRPPAEPDEAGRQQAEADDAERAVRGAAVPVQVRRAAARGGDDVDVGGVRGDEEGRRRAASGAPERRAPERRAEQRVSEVVQVNLI